MEQINIYSEDGTRVESRVVFAEDVAEYFGENLAEDLGEGLAENVVEGLAESGDACERNIISLMTLLPESGKIYIIADRNACDRSRFVAEIVSSLVNRGAAVRYIEASERGKTMEAVLGICSWLMDCGADRQAFVLAAGGGITTDMAGLAASLYMRGVRFAFVPTTLLSQVDAALGGKNGVNLGKYKNTIGVIRQPEFTYIAPSALDSLSYRDFLSGAAEMLKSFIIEDDGYYKKAVGLLNTLYNNALQMVSLGGEILHGTMPCDAMKHERKLCDAALPVAILSTIIGNLKPSEPAERIAFDKALQELIVAAVKVKVGIVSRDRFEKNERRKLNLGHTFAHAIETLSQRRNEDITHGEAVAIGIVMAACLSEKVKMSPVGTHERLSRDFKDCGLPFKCPYQVEELAEAMSKDKKSDSGKVHFALMRSIGNVTTAELTVEEACGLLRNV